MVNEDKKIEIIVAQWQTCVEMANSISQRRDTMNNIFITLNLAILASVSFSWDIKSILVLCAGIVICILWIFFIRNYKLLNREKFNVINELERKLPARPFMDEWKRLQKNKQYTDSTVLESVLPSMFMILYLIVIAVTIIIRICEKGGIV